MDKTLYVSDLDGTLLTPREDLSSFTIRVLNRLVEQGVAFTYATARSQHSADVVTRGLTKSLPVIIYNGAFIRRGERRETLLRQLLPGPSVARARQVFGEAGISPLVYTMAQGVERVLAEDRVEEQGEKESSQEQTTVICDGEDGEEVVLLTQYYPSFRGALVVCPGGDDPQVQLAITQAVSALTGLGSDRITICAGD